MATFSIDKSLQGVELGAVLGYNLTCGITHEIKDLNGELHLTKNQEDDIARLIYLGVYNNRISKSRVFIPNTFEANVLIVETFVKFPLGENKKSKPSLTTARVR